MQSKQTSAKRNPWQIMLGILVFFPFIVSAQYQVNPIAEEKRADPSLDPVFKNYNVYRIPTGELARYMKSRGKGEKAVVNLNFPGTSFPMVLEEQKLLSDNYQLVVGGENGKQQAGSPGTITFKGKLANDGQSRIYLTITEQTIFGVIKTGGREFYIEPLRNLKRGAESGLFVWYEASDVRPVPGISCGVNEIAERMPQLEEEAAGARASGNCQIVETAIASEHSMFLKYGSAQAVQEHNIGVMNMMVGIYQEAQFGSKYLEFRIVRQFVATIPLANPFLPGYSGDNMGIMLNNFKNWSLSGFGGGVSYDMAQLWTARNVATYSQDGLTPFYSVIGLAYLQGTCTSNRFQVLEDFSVSVLMKAAMAGHETGHNLNAQHDPITQFSIMAPSISNPPNTNFTSYTINEIVNYISGSGGACFSSCEEVAPTAEFNIAKAVCLNTPMSLTDYSVGGVTSRTWQFEGGTPATSSQITQSVSFATPGVKNVSLTVANAQGINTKTRQLLVSAAPVAACYAKGQTSTDFALVNRFILGDISYDNNSYVFGSIYVNGACSQISMVQPGRSYTANLGVGASHVFSNYSAPTKLQIVIDLNNDGDFGDANESLYYSEQCREGFFNVSLVMPETVPLINQFLRLRVIALPCSQGASNGCLVPFNAQVIDFSVYFTESTCLKTWYADADGDSYGDPAVSQSSCTQPANYVLNSLDCDDASSAIKPGATEVCDGVDNDCDGLTDEGVTTTYYVDADGDEYGSAVTTQACTKPTGYANVGGDCNDNDPAVNPGTSEVCANGKDDNCNAQTDETACIPCENASNISTTAITSTSAQLNWVAAANPLVWEIRYKRISGGSQWITLPQLTGNNRQVMINGLVPGAQYNWQVRARCGRSWTKYTEVALFATGSDASITSARGIGEVAGQPTLLQVSVRPNPSQSQFTIQVPDNRTGAVVQLTVTDLSGRLIEERQVRSGAVVELGAGYRNGVYLLRAVQGERITTFKLVKAAN